MSNVNSLWKAFFEDDVDSFRQLLAGSGYNSWIPGRNDGGSKPFDSGSLDPSLSSPSQALSTSPHVVSKARKISGRGQGTSSTAKGHGSGWTKAAVNSKDHHGLTLLHHAASSKSKNAAAFASFLLENPLVDLYIQDAENGWTALHRAFYFGNITIAREIMKRDASDLLNHHKGSSFQTAGGIFKVKDKEGNGPFDIVGATIAKRQLHDEDDYEQAELSDEANSETGDNAIGEGEEDRLKHTIPKVDIGGEEVFAWGSNKNVSLGLSNEDDRQYPERIYLTRPDHLFRRFAHSIQEETVEKLKEHSPNAEIAEPHYTVGQPIESLPILVRNKPLIIQNIFLSKLHTAILTKDPESNLYISGFGPGGRLGTGDEVTRFSYVCIEGGGIAGQRIVDIGLGQNHTIAVSDTGNTWSWGSNDDGQLGYNLPTRSKDERGMQLIPRQLFGPLKREVIIGAAASQIHSVVHTSTSLFTFGRNAGQLGIVDSDARSLEIQSTPRRVAASLFSSPIVHVTAIERATICLLENHDVWIFANFGYTKMVFQLDTFSNYFTGRPGDIARRWDRLPYHMVKIAAGGDTICALSSTGEVFTVTVSQKLEPAPYSASTTNPSKIRGALSQPQCIYSSARRHMAVVDVDVSQNGSIIICTEAGSVWVREKRSTGKESSQPSGMGQRPRGFKFRRIPGLTHVKAVRSNAYGAFAAVRNNGDTTKRQILVSKQALWDDLMPMLPFRDLQQPDSETEEEGTGARLWAPSRRLLRLEDLRQAIVRSPDIEAEILSIAKQSECRNSYDLEIFSTTSESYVPTYRVLCSARSLVLRRAFIQYQKQGQCTISDSIYLERGNSGKARLVFRGQDFLTITNLVLYLSQDVVVDIWHFNRIFTKNAFRYRQVRLELMALAVQLELPNLENAVRQMIEPKPSLSLDMDLAVQDLTFFGDADVCVQLAGAEMNVHSIIMILRCPFFEGLFNGRASGRWLSSRQETRDNGSHLLKIDLKHIEPSIFKLILRYVYSDIGEELFDDVVCQDLEEFSDLVLDVMSAANELMLDRLSQICQKVLGRFVNMRNACHLLNAIGPCSVTEFKNACLEYLCLNLEGMLENHLLDDLDDDMMAELDTAYRTNQLVNLPFIKSGKAEALLHEKHPDLAASIAEDRAAKIRSLAFNIKLSEEPRLGSLSKGKHSSLESTSPSPISQRKHRKSAKDVKPVIKQQGSPVVSKGAPDDHIFEMELNESSSPMMQKSVAVLPLLLAEDSTIVDGPEDDTRIWYDSKGKALQMKDRSQEALPMLTDANVTPPSVERSGTEHIQQPNKNPPTKHSWLSIGLSESRSDMADIMSQAAVNRTSNLAKGLSLQAEDQKFEGSINAKLTQRERKKQQQQQPDRSASTPTSKPATPKATEAGSPSKPSSPWQTAARGPLISLKEVLNPTAKPPSDRSSTQPQQQPSSALKATTRSPSPANPPKSSPQLRSPRRSSISTPSPAANAPLPRSPPPPPISSEQQPPHPSPTLNLSLTDIIYQQEAEQAILRKAVEKRSLQEIQQEQEFQEWWDSESKKVREEEERDGGAAAAAVTTATAREARNSNRGSGSGSTSGIRGRGKRSGRGRGKSGARRGGASTTGLAETVGGKKQ